jgi:hypothetical protein
MVTCPSAAITTWSLRRTQITVVERIRGCSSSSECLSKAKKNLRKSRIRQGKTAPGCSHEYIAALGLRAASACLQTTEKPTQKRRASQTAGKGPFLAKLAKKALPGLKATAPSDRRRRPMPSAVSFKLRL